MENDEIKKIKADLNNIKGALALLLSHVRPQYGDLSFIPWGEAEVLKNLGYEFKLEKEEELKSGITQTDKEIGRLQMAQFMCDHGVQAPCKYDSTFADHNVEMDEEWCSKCNEGCCADYDCWVEFFNRKVGKYC